MPAPAAVASEFALCNLPEIIQYTAQSHPEVTLSVAAQQGLRTDANRNAILAEALKDPSLDFILWLDCDMLYPADIIGRYLELLYSGISIDVVGCLYFRRGHPFDAVAYEKTGDPLNPYKPVFPPTIADDRAYEVDAIGFGGMLVSMQTYRNLGEKCWMHYGPNFHLPGDHPDKLTHDLQFCSEVKAAGMSVKLHGGVRAKHLYLTSVTIDDWKRAAYEDFEFRRRPPLVHVVLPSHNAEKGQIAAAVIKERAGCDCLVTVVHDNSGRGYVNIVNDFANITAPDLLVYANEHAVAGELWLKHALISMITSNAGLVGLHHGANGAGCAKFGLVNCAWTKQLFGNRQIFFPAYKTQLAGADLTALALRQDRYFYAERAVLLDGNLFADDRSSSVELQADRQLFTSRESAGFV